MGIVTVTLNPALDKTAVVDELRPGGLNRLRDVVVDAGGKGVNVSKTIRALGGISLATGFAGGGSGEEILHSLDARGIAHDFVRVASPTRANLKVLDRGGRLTELNEPGPEITAEEMEALSRKIGQWSAKDAIFVFSGSVPRGVDPGVYAELARIAKSGGARVFLDADGPAFSAALAERPAFVKPNRHELLEYFKLDGDISLDGLAALCRRLVDAGVGRVAMSMGREGALFVDGNEVLHAPGLEVEVRSSVGAGDGMVGAAAYGTAAGMPWRDIAALAMATSAGAVTTDGTKPPDRKLVDALLGRVVLKRL